jgi:hypothetical protein
MEDDMATETPPGADSQQACPPSHARDQKATPVQEAVHLNEVRRP